MYLLYHHFYRLKRNMHHVQELYYMTLFQSFNNEFGYNSYKPDKERFTCSDETKIKLANLQYNADRAVGIDVYNLEGKFLLNHTSINDAARKLHIKSNLISEIIRNTRKSYKGLTFVIAGEPFTYVPSSKQRNMSKYQKYAKLS